jgi:hypothetical protein
MEGFRAYVECVRKKLNEPGVDRWHDTAISEITSVEAIPLLLKLLTEVKMVRGDSMDLAVLEESILRAFGSIAQLSGDNLCAVSEALVRYIEENSRKLPNVKYLHNTIEGIRAEFYLKMEKGLTIQEALEAVGSDL